MTAEVTISNLKLPISPTIGSVSLEIMDVADALCVITLAHGAGAGMHHSFITSLCHALASHKITTVRFNFPYIENGKKRPDVAAVAEKTVGVVVEETHNRYSNLPLFCSGKSFGGRMTSQLLSKRCPAYVRGLVFFGFPLHPADNPSVTRAAHLSAISIPMLFLQGTRDSLAKVSLVKEVALNITNATVVFIEGADHSFKVGKQNSIQLLADHTREWIHNVLTSHR